EVVLIWHGVPDATSYTVASQPNYNIEGLGYTTTAKTILTGLQNGRSYLVSVTAESADLASFPSVLNITGSGLVIAPIAPVVPTRPYYDETEYGSAPQPNDNPFNNNYNNMDDNDGRIQNVPEEKNNLTWISIVVVVGVLFIMFVFLITVAICAGKNRKPLLRNGGCCWCFHCASGVKSCSCRGCCCDDDEYDGPYY
uniref:Fibronectin type-III domain-containing protein n=1 Tax=Ciona savignyi TaxID=51511 RepID=H2Z3X0_CIOSA